MKFSSFQVFQQKLLRGKQPISFVWNQNNTSTNYFSGPLKPFLYPWINSTVFFWMLLFICEHESEWQQGSWSTGFIYFHFESELLLTKIKHFCLGEKTSNKVITLVISDKYSPYCALFVKLTQSGIIWRHRSWIAQCCSQLTYSCARSHQPLNFISVSHRCSKSCLMDAGLVYGAMLHLT